MGNRGIESREAAPRHAILCAVGSSGDVHPFVGLGRVLLRRGWRVTVVTAGYFRGLVEGAGLEFIDPLPEVDFRDMIRDPRIWHPLRGTARIIDLAVRPLLEPIHRIVVERHEPGRTIVVGSSLAFGARVAQEQAGAPLVTVHLSPALFRSDYSGPRVPGICVHRGPAWFRRLQWWLIDMLAADRLICPWLNAYRSSLGLEPVRRVTRDWMHSPMRVLGMFPEWFAPRQPDWPPQTRLTGFPLYSEEGVVEPAAEVREFLASGPPPLVFTPGSANVFGRDFFAAAAGACRRLGRRGLLLTRFPEQVPQSLPDSVRHVDFVPFRWLLPRTAALVHHGGIGSLSQALAAAVPQVVMPMGFDQFDNAARLERLGVGRALSPRRFSATALAGVLRGQLEDPAVVERCRLAAGWLTGDDGLERAGDEVESAWRGVHARPQSAADGAGPAADGQRVFDAPSDR